MKRSTRNAINVRNGTNEYYWKNKMLAELGIVATAIALVAALFAAAASAYGVVNRQDRWVLSARNATLLTWPLLTIACVALIAAQITGEFNIAYVWSTTNISEPVFYKITALWGGQPGSLTFWAWVMSTFTGAAIVLNWRSERRLMPWVLTFTMLTLGFFLILVVMFENPFARLWLLPGSSQPVKAVFAPIGAVLFQP